MSHFTCLVIGQDIEKLLQPFHEFECTGINDQYVQDINVTAEKREEYAADSEYAMLDAEGKRHWLFTPEGEYDIRFYKEGQHGRKEQYIPPGWTETKVPASERFTFEQWAPKNCGPIVPPDGSLREEHKYGYVRLAEDGTVEQIVDRTNPNKKWDWWQLGGRWSGFFILKSGAAGRRGNNDAPSYNGKGHKNQGVDSALKGDIDFEAMRDKGGERAGEEYDRIHAVIKGRDWTSFQDMRAKFPGDIPAARAAYWEQDVLADMQKADNMHFVEIEEFRCTREAYVKEQRDRAIMTFAFLKDGQWNERGEMGFFATVSDEKDPATWTQQFNAMLDSLPDDAVLSVVDCHI